MSELRPRGEEVIIEGVKRYFLFTLNVVDEIQSRYDMALSDVLDKLTDKREAVSVMRFIVYELLRDEVLRKRHFENDQSLKSYSEEEVGWLLDENNQETFLIAVLKAYGVSLPDLGDEDPPKAAGGQMKK